MKFCVKNNMVSILREAVKPNLFPLLMIFAECLNHACRVANVMFCCWTSVRLLTRFPILVYVISYVTMEFTVHSYPGFKLFYTTDPSTWSLIIKGVT